MNNALSNMPKYDSYVPSGQDWLDAMPSGWPLLPGMRFFKENSDSNKGMIENTVLSLSYGNIIIKPEEKLVGLVPESFETYQIVEPGDIIIRCTDLQNDQVSLRTGLAKNRGIITSAYLNLRPREGQSSRFLHYYLHALDLTKVLYKFGSGLRQNLSFVDFKRLPLPSLDRDTQQAIANFLDEKTAQIDQAIEIKEKQIALLKEHKQILIQNAVTRGLNPNVPLKDSGIDWIGQIPAHWKVKKFKYLLQKKGFVRGPFGSALQTSFFTQSGYKVYEQKNAIYDDIALGSSYIPNHKFQELSRFAIKEGDFLMSCSGTIGKITQVPKFFEEGIINQAMLIIRVDPKFYDFAFFTELFRSDFMQAQFIENSKGSAMKNLVGTDIFKNMRMVIPPKKEQNNIFGFLKEKSAQIDETIGYQNQQIEKLKEYKASLINSAVTGKIKVV